MAQSLVRAIVTDKQLIQYLKCNLKGVKGRRQYAKGLERIAHSKTRFFSKNGLAKVDLVGWLTDNNVQAETDAAEDCCGFREWVLTDKSDDKMRLQDVVDAQEVTIAA